MAGYDEAFTPGGGVREPYAAALAALDAQGPGLEDTGIAIGGGAAARPLPVDPIPRIFTAREWAPLAAGLEQRARLLEALMRLGGPPPSPHHEPGLPLDGPPLAVVGFDVARRPDGGFALLEENVLTPGHVALPAAREAARLWERSAPLGVAAPLREALRDALGEDAAILADDPPSWETRWLGRFLGVPVVGLDEAGGRLPRTVWYRTAEDRLRDDAGALTPLGELLLEPLLERRVRVLNRPGAGVVEDKRLLIDAPRTLRAVLGEAPLLRVVETVPATAAVDPRRYVFKPAHGAGGRDVAVRPSQPVGD